MRIRGTRGAASGGPPAPAADPPEAVTAAGARPRAVRAARNATAVAAAAVTAAFLLAGCAGGGSSAGRNGPGSPAPSSGAAHAPHEGARATGVPGVGDRLRAEIPAAARQVVTVRGAGEDSARSTVRLYEKRDGGWERERTWAAHNGKKGWTRDHHEGDKRSPVGVFTLSDAGGVLAAPGSRLPYAHSAAFTPSSAWPVRTRHDFDHVIAIDYNRVRGRSPLDPERPEGQAKGGSIWLHMDHGSGTSGCVSLSQSGMEYLLKTLDPDKHPVVVMGDAKSLAAG